MVRQALLLTIVTLVAVPHAGAHDEPLFAVVDKVCPYHATSPDCLDRGFLMHHDDEVTICASRVRDPETTDAKFCTFDGQWQSDGDFYQSVSPTDPEKPCRIEISYVGNIVRVTPWGPDPTKMVQRCRRQHCGSGGFLFGEFQVTAELPPPEIRHLQCGA